MDVNKKNSPPFAKPPGKNFKSSVSTDLPPCSDKEIEKTAALSSGLMLDGTKTAVTPLAATPMGAAAAAGVIAGACVAGAAMTGFSMGAAPAFSGIAAGFVWIAGSKVPIPVLGTAIVSYAACSTGVTYVMEKISPTKKEANKVNKILKTRDIY